MTTLTPIHREVINLISYRGKEVEEVAQTTGVPVSTIKTRLHYARGHLAQTVRCSGHRSRVDGVLKRLQHCKNGSQSPDPDRN
jgi:DNA-directed RNA polymerase specialized sigma24 family protein